MIGSDMLFLAGGYTPDGVTASTLKLSVDPGNHGDSSSPHLVVEEGPDLPEALVEHCVVEVTLCVQRR